MIAWQGVYVSARRAVALADVRTRSETPFRRLSRARTRLELLREGHTWRILDVAALRG